MRGLYFLRNVLTRGRKDTHLRPALLRPFSSGADVFMNSSAGAYVEAMHEAWLRDPSSVHISWRTYFEQLSAGKSGSSSFVAPPSLGSFTATLAASTTPPSTGSAFSASSQASLPNKDIQDHLKVQLLVRAYQVRGHLRAKLDPLGITTNEGSFKVAAPELEPSFYGFTEADMSREFHLGSGLLPEFISERPVMTLRDILQQLERAYSGSVGYEYIHIPDRGQCNWLRARIEVPQPFAYSKEEQLVILDRLLWGTLFERFVAVKYPSEKRFGLEGCEALIPGLKALIDRSVDEHGVERIVMGMPHRGRLNVLSNVVRKSNESIFSEFRGSASQAASDMFYSGDVKYHLGMQYERPTPKGNRVELSLVANPSHLEAVDPVVEGKVRALQHFTRDEPERARTLALLMHGDAAFAGQGVVYETLGMSALPNYCTGGTVHVIVNNQIGFTTDPRFARSTPYCSDLAKSIAAPIFHVNADDPEAVVHVFSLAADWRRQFKSDVVVDLVGYRKHGHNEVDQPAFTQPRMYAAIAKQTPALDQYAEKLKARGTLDDATWTQMKDRVWSQLEKSYAECKDYRSEPFEWQTSRWPGFKTPLGLGTETLPPKPTGVLKSTLERIADTFTAWPTAFKPHPGVKRIMEARTAAVRNESAAEIDMSTAEALAFGSLILQGIHVRLGGQDVERGTFSQRHAVIHNQDPQDERTFLPLQTLKNGPVINGVPVHSDVIADLIVCNSHLSEFGALGFELGYSLVSPHALVLWEAQFGDFANNAQCIIDQFLASGERKWLQRTGLVLLLPHGYDGAGPEHSNARLERFLTLCDDDPLLVLPSQLPRQIQACNLQVCYPTTPANYFHLLRRQIERDFRKPLVVLESKSLMRHPAARSNIADFLPGTDFKRYIPAKIDSPQAIDTLVLCSGQVYYALEKARQANELKNVAIARVEQLSPFPYDLFMKDLESLNGKGRQLKRIVWAQEEPLNLGAWTYLQPRIFTALNSLSPSFAAIPLQFAGRRPTAAVATGHKHQHLVEEYELLSQALFGKILAPKRIEVGTPIF